MDIQYGGQQLIACNIIQNVQKFLSEYGLFIGIIKE